MQQLHAPLIDQTKAGAQALMELKATQAQMPLWQEEAEVKLQRGLLHIALQLECCNKRGEEDVRAQVEATQKERKVQILKTHQEIQSKQAQLVKGSEDLEVVSQWAMATNPEGTPYFYQATTGVTQWSQPENFGKKDHLEAMVAELPQRIQRLQQEAVNLQTAAEQEEKQLVGIGFSVHAVVSACKCLVEHS